jgi:hypothetical protein
MYGAAGGAADRGQHACGLALEAPRVNGGGAVSPPRLVPFLIATSDHTDIRLAPSVGPRGATAPGADPQVRTRMHAVRKASASSGCKAGRPPHVSCVRRQGRGAAGELPRERDELGSGGLAPLVGRLVAAVVATRCCTRSGEPVTVNLPAARASAAAQKAAKASMPARLRQVTRCIITGCTSPCSATSS